MKTERGKLMDLSSKKTAIIFSGIDRSRENDENDVLS